MSLREYTACNHYPKSSLIRYKDETTRSTIVSLGFDGYLEVKRNGQSTKNHFDSYEDWVATLPPAAQSDLFISEESPREKKNPCDYISVSKDTTDVDLVLRILHAYRLNPRKRRLFVMEGIYYGPSLYPITLGLKESKWCLRYRGRTATTFKDLFLPDSRAGYYPEFYIYTRGQIKRVDLPENPHYQLHYTPLRDIE